MKKAALCIPFAACLLFGCGAGQSDSSGSMPSSEKTSSQSEASSSSESSNMSSSDPEKNPIFRSTFDFFDPEEVVQAPYQLRNGNFEMGSLDYWYKQNEEAPFEISNDEFDIFDNAIRKEGVYFLGLGKTNYDGAKEKKMGAIRSSLFRLSQTGQIRLKLGGSNEKEIAVKLYHFKGGHGRDELVETFNNVRFGVGNLSGFIMNTYLLQLDVSRYSDPLFYFVLEDKASSNFGFINLDGIETDLKEPVEAYATDLANYCSLKNHIEAVKDATLLKVESKHTERTEFEFDEDFDSSTLQLYGTYSNHLLSIVPKSSYSVDSSSFRKGVAGSYEIRVSIKNSDIVYSYSVNVLPKGQERSGKIAVSNEDKLLVIGDSIMAMWDNIKKDLPFFHSLTNLAVGGTTSVQWLEKIKTIDASLFQYVLINLGGNDMRALALPPKKIKENMTKIFQEIHGKNPEAIIFLFTPTTSPGNYYSFHGTTLDLIQEYRTLAQELPYIRLIDVSTAFIKEDGFIDTSKFRPNDSLHPNAEGYLSYAASLKRYIA